MPYDQTTRGIKFQMLEGDLDETRWKKVDEKCDGCVKRRQNSKMFHLKFIQPCLFVLPVMKP